VISWKYGQWRVTTEDNETKKHSINIGVLMRKKPHASPLVFCNADIVLMRIFFRHDIFQLQDRKHWYAIIRKEFNLWMLSILIHFYCPGRSTTGHNNGITTLSRTIAPNHYSLGGIIQMIVSNFHNFKYRVQKLMSKRQVEDDVICHIVTESSWA